MRAILDTNVIVAALRSRHGASNEIIKRLALGEYSASASTALILEYDDVLARPEMVPGYDLIEIGEFIDSLCAVLDEAYIYFRWRPFLPDPKDDMIFECALASGASHIITFNLRDFPDLSTFGILVMTPGDFLDILRQ